MQYVFYYPTAMPRKTWGLGEYTWNPTALNQAAGAGVSTANQTGSAIAGSIASGFILASSFDPEPISRTLLQIGSALTGIITKVAQGCGSSCIAASDAANQAEPLLVQNVATYTSSPVRTRSMQLTALANFDNVFGALLQKCQQIGGQAGQNCVKDRTAGSCKWKASPWTWTKTDAGGYVFTPAGPNGSGTTCWNWVYGYRDSIASDPDVVPDSVSASTAGTLLGLNLFGGAGSTVDFGGTSIPTEYLLLGALAVGALFLL